MTIYQMASLAILSGVASVDRLAGMNIMVSRPMVVAGIVGIIFNDVTVCLVVGILFEFVGMVQVPVGTTVAQDDTFAGYAAALLVAMGAASQNAASMLLCVFAVALMIYPVTLTDKYFRYLNRLLITKNIKARSADFESRLIYYGIGVAFFRGVIVYNIGAGVVWCFLYLIDKIHNTAYSPYISLMLLATFMGGYLVRFLSINNMMKVTLLFSGMAFGWFIL